MICGEQNKHLEFGKVGVGFVKTERMSSIVGEMLWVFRIGGEIFFRSLTPLLHFLNGTARDTNRFQTWPNASGHDGNKVAMALWPYETNKQTSASNVFASFVLLTV